MQAREDADHRIAIVEESLAVARVNFNNEQWPPCIDYCQQAIENAAKAVLAMFGAPPPTHRPGLLLLQEVPTNALPRSLLPALQRLAKLSDDYGPDVHMRVRYGDEVKRITPRGLFGEDAAREALAAAEEALGHAKDVLAALP